MFDLLKKKLTGFADKLKQTISAKPTEEKKPLEAIVQPVQQEQKQAIKEPVVEQPKTKIAEELEELTQEEKEIEQELKAADEKLAKQQEKKEKVVEKNPVVVEKPTEKIIQKEKLIEKPLPVAVEKPAITQEAVVEEPVVIPKFEEKKRELKAKVGIFEKAKSVFTGSIEIKQSDVASLLEELELSLLEADVEQETALEICNDIKKELVGKKIPAGKLNDTIKEEIKKVLQRIMTVEKIDLLSAIGKKKPFVILLLGPNGAGKTTSLAKLTFLLQAKGKTVIWAAADTFRAASIEQLETHAARLKVRVVKHKYGADPAAVAFDAIKAAEAAKADVVLIDSAGRQETNRNLMEELKKIVRVAKPDLKIYVGESYTGQALLQQATEFNESLGLSGFILTKIDCDVKGGTTISLLFKLKKPILFVGTGQEYKDLQAFDSEFVLGKIF